MARKEKDLAKSIKALDKTDAVAIGPNGDIITTKGLQAIKDEDYHDRWNHHERQY